MYRKCGESCSDHEEKLVVNKNLRKVVDLGEREVEREDEVGGRCH